LIAINTICVEAAVNVPAGPLMIEVRDSFSQAKTELKSVFEAGK
jgi:hypothetical protein